MHLATMVTMGPVCLMKLTRKRKLIRTLGFQSRKRLYNHQCPFVRLSVCLKPKPTNSLKSFISPYHNIQHHSHHYTYHNTTSQHNITLNITKQSHTLSQPSTILILNTPSPTPTHAPSHTTSRHHSYHQHQCYNQPLHHHRLLISRLLSFSACLIISSQVT